MLPSSTLLSLLPQARVVGAMPDIITGIASLETAKAGELSFLGNTKYRKQVGISKASVILVPEDFPEGPQEGQAFLYVKNPSLALAQVCGHLEKKLLPSPAAGIHPTAVIAPDARIAATATVGPFCVVESGVTIGERTVLTAHVYVGLRSKIGEDCLIFPRVTLYHDTILGNRVRIHAGVVVGSDGFGYETAGGVHHKVPQIGNVEIEDDVEIGANTAIDRARFATTRIRSGSKIDNLVQLAHNVEVGRHCLIAAQTGISGSTTLGNYVVMGGQSAAAGHIHIGDQTMVGGQSGVSKDLPPKSFVSDSPAYDFKEYYRIEAHKRRLPEYVKRIDALEAELKALKAKQA